MNCIEGTWDYIATCLPGLAKNGTNVTILIKDKVEIYISGFEYTVRNKTQNLIENTTENQTENNTVDYDAIDAVDWRMGGGKPTTERGGDIDKGNKTLINITITNNTVGLNSNSWLQDIIVFRD